MAAISTALAALAAQAPKKEAKAKKDKQLTGWCMTLTDRSGLHWEEIKKTLVAIARKWAFQKERGEGAAAATDEAKREAGYLHWQIKFGLHKRARLHELVKALKGTTLEGGHLSPAVTSAKEKMDYVMKDQTRVEGPWTSEDDGKDEIPDDLVGRRLREWQAQIEEDCKRVKQWINILCDIDGQLGKSFLVKWLEYNGFASYIPPMPDAKDMAQAVMNKKKHHCYLIDIYRQTTPEKLRAMFGAAEQIATGFVYDPRNHYRQRIQGTTKIWIFTNMHPRQVVGLLSHGRYSIWMVGPDNRLCRWTAEKGDRRMAAISKWRQAQMREKEAAEEPADEHCAADDLPDGDKYTPPAVAPRKRGRHTRDAEVDLSGMP